MELLQQVTDLWLKQIELAKQAKEEQFGRAAKRAWQYLGRDYLPLYLETEHEFPDGTEGSRKPIIVAKSAEFVALMLPYIHAKVPHRLATPSRPPMPMDIPIQPELAELVLQNRALLDADDNLRAWLLKFWLNYISHEGYDLAAEQRRVLPEALVKGACVTWTELTEGPYGLMPASFGDTIDSLFIDPDVEQMRDAGYIVRKRTMAIWRIADRFGFDRDKLRGQLQTSQHRSLNSTQPPAKPGAGDVGEYYEIWSRMGIGHKLLGASDDMKEERAALDTLGGNVFLAIMDGVPHPLNLPPHVLESQDRVTEVKQRLQWPIAFFAEVSDPWPCSPCLFYPHSHDPWGESPLAGGLQCQIFLDSLYYYLMRRVRTSCRDLIVTSKALGEKVKTAIESGKNFEIVEEEGRPGVELKELMEIIEFPSVNSDLWSVVQMVERQFERVTGMTPLLSGAQPDATARSATDVRAREGHATSRPDDFADVVERFNSRIAAKEAQATRLYVGPPYELFGEPRPGEDGILAPEAFLSAKWTQLVMTDSPAVAASELSYTVEAGSGRRRNKQKQADDAVQMIQVLSDSYLQYGFQTGNFDAHNAMITMLGEALDIPIKSMLLPNLTLPQPSESSGA